MDQDISKIMTNPVRLRIIQYLILHEKGTPAQMMQELSDIPPASLYRHIKMLYEAGCIEVTEEKKIRGTVERTYALNAKIPCELAKGGAEQLIQSSLMSLMTSFNKYFARGEIDPIRDMLSLSTSTLFLSDEEFMEVLEKIGDVISPYLYNKLEEGRKVRRFTFISSPCEEDR